MVTLHQGQSLYFGRLRYCTSFKITQVTAPKPAITSKKVLIVLLL
jgi:hypothetical protein